MENKKLLAASKLILYFGIPFFVGGFFNLLGRVDSLPDYFFVKLGVISVIASILGYWVEQKLMKSVKGDKL